MPTASSTEQDTPAAAAPAPRRLTDEGRRLVERHLTDRARRDLPQVPRTEGHPRVRGHARRGPDGAVLAGLR